MDVRAVAMATGVAVVSSAARHHTLGRRIAELDEAFAEAARPAAGVLFIEVGRNATWAAAGAVLVRRTDISGLRATSRLAADLWVGFPAVHLTGSMMPERFRGSSPRSAAATG